MEVTEASTGQNVQKSSASETVSETVVNIIKGNEDSTQTVSVSETIQITPANGTETTIEEIVEEVEVTDQSDGEDVVEVIEVQTQETKQTETESGDIATLSQNVGIVSKADEDVEIHPTNAAPAAGKRSSITETKIEKKETSVEEIETEEEEVEEEEEEEVEIEEEEEETEATEQNAEIIETEHKASLDEETKTTSSELPQNENTEETLTEQLAELRVTEKENSVSAVPDLEPTAIKQSDLEARKASISAESLSERKASIPAEILSERKASIPVEISSERKASIPAEISIERKPSIPAAQPISQNGAHVHHENIRNQLQEIVSDIDKAVEENQMFNQSNSCNTMSTSQSKTTSDYLNQTTNHVILQPPTYFNQEDNKSSTTCYSSKPIDLKKIFTPATDAEEITPHKNRKLYASSAFFTPGLHPTVEDQVELARRISSSLSDANNKLSKGQTMYVNRKKRSVKWIHEGEGKNDNINFNGYYEQKLPSNQQQYQDTTSYSEKHHHETKIPLKLVMDPRGVVQDVHTQGITFDPNNGMLSPDKCAELVSALHTDAPRGKGAELFAKRRKRSEKWVVDETTRSSNNPAFTSYSAGPTPIYDTHQFNDYNQTVNQYTDQQRQWDTPRAKTPQWDAPRAKTPQWEAPRAKTPQWDAPRAKTPSYTRRDFHDVNPYYSPSNNTSAPQYQAPPSYSLPKHTPQPLKRNSNSLRDLAYKPSIPQGWNAPPANLPNEMFTPPEIPLSGYTPPQTDIYLPKTSYSTPAYYPHHQYENTHHAPTDFYQKPMEKPFATSMASPLYHVEPVPVCKNLQPSQVYAHSPVQNFTPKPFTPSPIAHEKLAIFEPNKHQQQSSPIRRPLTVPNQTVRNVSPLPFGFNEPYEPKTNNNWRNSNEYTQSCSFMASSSSANYEPLKSALKSPGISHGFSHQGNHNRAARGWGQSQEFYRPISFIKQLPVELPYTDF